MTQHFSSEHPNFYKFSAIVMNHEGPQLENNCGFPGSETKSSAVDGNTKVVKQAQKFQGEAFFFFSIVPKNAER